MSSAVEKLLSEIADYGAQLLRNRPDAQLELARLLEDAHNPFVNRPCQQPRGAILRVSFDAERF